jgi:Flp pilus assembly protein TadD
VFLLFIRQSAFIRTAVGIIAVAGLTIGPSSAAKLLPEQRAEFLFDRGHKALDENKAELAEKFYRRAIELNPDDSRFHRQLAVVLIKLGRGQEAERELAIAVNMDPKDWRAMLLQGSIAHAQKRYEAETVLYKKIIAILPADQSALKTKLEKFIVDDEILAKKAAEIAKHKKEEEAKQYQW